VKGVRVPSQPKAQVNKQDERIWTVTMGNTGNTAIVNSNQSRSEEDNKEEKD